MTFREELWKTIVQVHRENWRLIRTPFALATFGLVICMVGIPVGLVMPKTSATFVVIGGLIFVIGDGWFVGRIVLDSGKRLAREMSEIWRKP